MKRKILVLSLVLALIFPMTSCAKKATLESLLEDAAEKSAKLESYEMDAVLDVDIDLDIETMSIGVQLGGEANVTTTEDATYISGEATYNVFTENDTIEMEAYLMKDGDEYIVYTDAGDGWTMTSSEDSTDMDPDDISGVFDTIQMGKLIELLADHSDDLELNEELDKVNKKDAYLIEGDVSGEYLMDLLENMDIGDTADSLTDALDDTGIDFDIEDITVEVSLWIDKKTTLPVKMTIDFSSFLQGYAVDGLTQLMGAGGDDAGEISEYLDAMKIVINECIIEMEFSSFDDVDEIEVPDAVIDQAEIGMHNEEIQEAISEIDAYL